MTQHTERQSVPNTDKCSGVLDGPQCIDGLPKQETSAAQQAVSPAGGRKPCQSVLDGPECIQGIPASTQRS